MLGLDPCVGQPTRPGEDEHPLGGTSVVILDFRGWKVSRLRFGLKCFLGGDKIRKFCCIFGLTERVLTGHAAWREDVRSVRVGAPRAPAYRDL